jgi:hypothetical protein
VGRIGRRNGERGYVLLDALIALVIVFVGLAACMGGIGLAGRMAARERERVILMIEERNAQAME